MSKIFKIMFFLIVPIIAVVNLLFCVELFNMLIGYTGNAKIFCKLCNRPMRNYAYFIVHLINKHGKAINTIVELDKQKGYYSI